MKLHTSPIPLLTVALLMLTAPALVSANHAWGNYHWARAANPVTITLGSNVDSTWSPYLATTAADWSLSAVVDTPVGTGGTSPRRCKPDDGNVEVCNLAYGNNGWLGLAQIWASGDHIVKGAVKVNDTYFNAAPYNTPAWRNLVMCQEVGHILGLGHVDEEFGNPNLDTCMDYTSNPDTNQQPNDHDYDQLLSIYEHLDTVSDGGGNTGCRGPSWKCGGSLPPPAMGDLDLDDLRNWGRLVASSKDGRTAVFELDFGGGHKVFTFVIWA